MAFNPVGKGPMPQTFAKEAKRDRSMMIQLDCAVSEATGMSPTARRIIAALSVGEQVVTWRGERGRKTEAHTE